MSEITSFLSAQLTDIGLAAAADPHFAERLLEALRRLPAAGAGELACARETNRERPEELCA
jgi:hypothetical protein